MQSLTESLLSKSMPKDSIVPKLAKKVVGNTATTAKSGPGSSVAGKAKPLRSTKTSQKLVLFPSEPADSATLIEEQEDEDGSDETTPVVHLPLELHVLGSRTVAERMKKDQRDRLNLPRVSAYCVADTFQTDEIKLFLKEQHHVTPRQYDECIYAPYHFPIMTLRPGGKNSTNVRLRSAPWPESDEAIHDREEYFRQFENEQMTYEEDHLYANALENEPEPHNTNAESLAAHEIADFYEGTSHPTDTNLAEPTYATDGDITEPKSVDQGNSFIDQHLEDQPDFTAETSLSQQLDPEMVKTDEKIRAEQRRDSEHSTKAAHTKPFTGGELFVFDYGVLVFWNFSRAQELLMLEDLSPFTIRPLKDNPDDLEDMQIEEMHFQYDTTQKHSRIFNDMLTLKSGNHMIKLTLSHGISQSAVLARYEDIMDNTIEATKHIPKKLALTGKLDMKRAEMTQINGHLFKLRMNVNLSSNVLDTPEIFWSEPSLQPLYNAIRDYLEIPQRAAILNDRCTVISDLLSMLREHMNNFGVE
ncbi:hypothetical protein K450DRAFT_225693 [Umbelopsis ramanniana AG]|uniref:DUF155 domain-containing protein n=1 Tax=Umbelopsis ramanniana AG TaxID=1314678 RepID=A0AAD5EIK4_UMBRA|nr:uncharacterized protein K450DRAFT_225693 [Umbelopsis ramanniana AG]KAI8582970.1 hypothetical protein K450DRAFT_225693 [Umbelopsis ramanniana AG]